MLKVAITGGTGRMGKALIQAAQHAPEIVVTAVTISPRQAVTAFDLLPVQPVPDLHKVITEFEVLIDFTNPEASLAYLEQCYHFGKNAVIGTTGFNEQQKKCIKELSEKIAIVLAPNTSVGVNLCLQLLKKAALVLGSEVDIDIIEAHHHHKKDAPSGTALAMGEAIHSVLEQRSPKIAFSSIRAGDIVGEHTVMFSSEGERVEITHKATNRANFALGALRAAKWVANKANGLYSMQDVLA